MKQLSPVCSSTKEIPYGNDWLPADFSDFIREFEHIISACSGDDPLPLLRGHSDYRWALDSTFVRNTIERVLCLKDYRYLSQKVRNSIGFHRVVTSLLLFKFGVLSQPHPDLFDREKTEGLDPWFEFMKNCQQYPEKNQSILAGTNIIDWTSDMNVALYFANENRSGHGSVWISDAHAMGRVWQVKKVREILDLMNTKDSFESPKGVPLIVHPQKQTSQLRAVRQKAIYVAQMDFRYDLADMWIDHEKQFNRERVVVNLIVPDGTQQECEEYLNSQSPPITHAYLFPD